ncbi:MAG: hypothetical protein GY927_19800 [bacterium]|nr:hypothetical protein [Gammaproteobacteria bacterium]MCP4936381.1 hypothetical protein [bacterium]
MNELPHWAIKAKKRLAASGELLCRQVSDCEEALERGDGYLYFTHPSGKKFPTKSAALLIEVGEVSSKGDGLFDGFEQTFELRQ